MTIKTKPYKNLWNAAKRALRGKFTVIKDFLKKQKQSQIKNLTYHLKELEESKPKVNKRKETIKFREDISKIDQ